MKDEETLYIKKEVDAIARKVVADAVRKIADNCLGDMSPDNLIACTMATAKALERSTFDVHITVQPRKDGLHVETTVKGSVSHVQRDDDEE